MTDARDHADRPDHRHIKPSLLAKYRQAKARRDADILRARRDPAFFVEYVVPHDKTRQPIVNAPFHNEWHAFFSNTRRGVISAAIEHGKTLQIGVGRILWEIGNDPELRCIIIGASEDAAIKKILSPIKKEMKINQRLHEVFPLLRRSSNRDDPWSSREITVERMTTGDPTLQARGPGAKDILGSRLDLVIIDDLLNEENTGTKAARDKLHAWLDDTVLTRIVDIVHGETASEADIFGRVFIIGNPWNADDLIARLSKLKAWDSMTTSAVENPDDPPPQWRPTWPEQWPLRRLMQRRDETQSAHSFARKYLCRILSDDIRRFQKAWLDHMFTQGRGRQLLDRRPRINGAPMRCFTGVDFGIGRKKKDAETVLFTIAVDPRPPFRRIIVGIEAGRWKGPEILRRCSKVSRLYDSELCTESNQAQEWMGQFAEDFEGLPVLQLHTGRNKWSEEYGVESIAVEMKAGLWIAPTGVNGFQPSQATIVSWPTEYDDLAIFAQDCFDYDPDSHTPDRLMAAWKAREGARLWLGERWQASNHAVR